MKKNINKIILIIGTLVGISIFTEQLNKCK